MKPWLALLRPRQWTKNAFCLAGLIFSGRYLEPHSIALALLCTALFCLASSAVYILNDLRDRASDRLHPTKKYRPLASGAIAPAPAAAIAAALLLAATALSTLLPPAAAACLLAYLLLQAAYTLALKRLPLLDVTSIALGFVLRLLAGVYAVLEIPTTWITLSTFFLAMFLGFSKRRAELAGSPASLASPEASAAARRPALANLTLASLDALIATSAATTVLFYALFCVLSGKNNTLIVTVPLVYYAISRYQTAVLTRAHNAEEPEAILLRDRTLQLILALWLALYFLITLTNPHLFR